MATHLIELIENLPRCRVLLIGDMMVDRYLYGNAERLSPEAPVPVLHFQKEELRLGGAGSVAANLAALGAIVTTIGVIGRDETGKQLIHLLNDIGADASRLVHCDRPTTCKMRLVGSAQHRHPQQMIRLDFEDAAPINQDQARKLIDSAIIAMETTDLICIEDYNKGAVTAEVCRAVIEQAKHRGLPVLIDPPGSKIIVSTPGPRASNSIAPRPRAPRVCPSKRPSNFSKPPSDCWKHCRWKRWC